MMKLFGFVFLLFSGSSLCAESEVVTHLGKQFRVYRAQPEQVRLVWQGGDGKPLYSLQAAYRELAREGKTIEMLMNGGIFEPGNIPSGLYLEKGKTLHPVNLKAGKGNFFLKPNAVFFIRKTKDRFSAGIMESQELSLWSQQKMSQLWYAVQSGPALLLDGKKHPAFNRGSKSELLRNGVGVTPGGEVIFVISDGRKNDCNLWTFADCFRALGCKNALFLDGDISQMKVNPTTGVKGHGFASIFGVFEKTE